MMVPWRMRVLLPQLGAERLFLQCGKAHEARDSRDVEAAAFDATAIQEPDELVE
jgi:hypothetical protein